MSESETIIKMIKVAEVTQDQKIRDDGNRHCKSKQKKKKKMRVLIMEQ